MPPVTAQSPTHALRPTPGVRPWRWTLEKYLRAEDLGFFAGRRVELVDGKVIEMAPQHEPHVVSVIRSDAALKAAFGEGYFVRTQAPLNLSSTSSPEPDLAVVPGTPEDYLRSGAPTSALLVIEVSDKTLAYDRGRKLALYAKHGIQDYWIVNLVDWQLEIHRRPVHDPSARRPHGYAEKTITPAGGSVEPLARPGVAVRAADLLPPFRVP